MMQNLNIEHEYLVIYICPETLKQKAEIFQSFDQMQFFVESDEKCVAVVSAYALNEI